MSFGVSSIGGSSADNCGMVVPMWRGWRDWPCVSSNVITCACEHPEQMYLQLRGLCARSHIDQFYVPRNKKLSGALYFIGLMSSLVQYDEQTVAWHLLEATHNTTAVSEAPLASYVLGSHEWLIERDNPVCSPKGAAYRRTLKLTGCREGEFTCSDGQCISMQQRCDQIIHCRDESDEDSCKLIVFKESYNRKVPPFTVNPLDLTMVPVQVQVSTALMNVLAISEFTHTIDLKLGITLNWYENRVFYHNLKGEEALNVLSDAEVNKS